MCKTIYRALVANIAKEMVIQLEANQHKGDRANWVNVPPKVLLGEIYYHTGKLQQALSENDPAKVKEYCADIANLAAMVMDAKGLTDIDQRVQEPHRSSVPSDFNGS